MKTTFFHFIQIRTLEQIEYIILYMIRYPYTSTFYMDFIPHLEIINVDKVHEQKFLLHILYLMRMQ